jgi:hypothetical protein
VSVGVVLIVLEQVTYEVLEDLREDGAIDPFAVPLRKIHRLLLLRRRELL